jgi:dissimilatory sulfite reductase (desulfoviridin) alpha/beta subunit
LPPRLPGLQEFARIAETYGDGTTRLTCEENILFVNVPNEKLPAMLAEPIFQDKFKVNPGGWQWRDQVDNVRWCWWLVCALHL